VGGTTDTFMSPGIAVLDDQAFVMESNFFNGTLRAYDITDR
jgi:hypothetical protein